MWNVIAPLAGGIVGGLAASKLFGGGLTSILIGAGAGAILGSLVKQWIAPAEPHDSAGYAGARNTPPTGGTSPVVGADVSQNQRIAENKRRAEEESRALAEAKKRAGRMPEENPSPASDPEALALALRNGASGNDNPTYIPPKPKGKDDGASAGFTP